MLNKVRIALAVLGASFIGIVLTPEMLSASDAVAIAGLDNTSIVQTIPLPVSDFVNEEIFDTTPALSEPTPDYSYTLEYAQDYFAPAATATESVAVNVAPAYPANYIQVGGNMVEVIDVGNTDLDAGNSVFRYGGKFLYGHNTANVFGVLYNVGVGSTFVVSSGGIAQTYRVDKVVIYEQTDAYTLTANGVDTYRSDLIKARPDRKSASYDLALMTCYGTVYADGNASHRYVVFASAI